MLNSKVQEGVLVKNMPELPRIAPPIRSYPCRIKAYPSDSPKKDRFRFLRLNPVPG